MFTDVTRQRDPQRELARFRELAADVLELLLSAESREELERTFCETVASTIEGSTAMLARVDETHDSSVTITTGEVDTPPSSRHCSISEQTWIRTTATAPRG